VASLRDEIRAVEQDLRDLRESADDAPDRPLE
jgi:predicted Fe-Mo cluster-binding NifX family protein